MRRAEQLWILPGGGCCEQEQAYLLGLLVSSLNSDAAEPEHAAGAASGRQQLQDQRPLLLLQRQHERSLQDGRAAAAFWLLRS